jgi:hypothetical protein
MRLNEVFGIATEVSPASYVTRGGLDERLGYYLATQRHIAIHGDSKQGKTWLRARLLDSADTTVVQCQVETTPESLFREALANATLSAERAGHCCISGSCLGSAYMDAQPWSMASGRRRSWCQDSLL